MSISAERHAQLRHHLPSRIAHRVVDEHWLRARFSRYCAAAGITADLYVTRNGYHRATGQRPRPANIGMAFRPAGEGQQCIFIDLEQLRTRGQAELELAHEIMHLRWWSYGHRAIAFTRAQQLIDTVAHVGHAP